MVTFTLIGLCVLLFVPGLVSMIRQDPDGEAGWYYRAMLWPVQPDWWSWLTYMFTHAGFMHLLGNMLYLFLFGSPVEDTLGRVWYVVFYLFSGIASALIQIVFSAEGFRSKIPLCGASGAISACLGAYMLLNPKARVQLGYFFLIIIRPVYGSFHLPA